MKTLTERELFIKENSVYFYEDDEGVSRWIKRRDEWLAENAPSDWISVEDRLPTKTGRYWAVDEQSKEGREFLFFTKHPETGEENIWGWNHPVTHWRSLPQPPEDE